MDDDDEVEYGDDGVAVVSQKASSLLVRVSDRPDHFQVLLQNRRNRESFVAHMLHPSTCPEAQDLTDSQMELVEEQSPFLKHADAFLGQLKEHFPMKHNTVETRVQDLNYRVNLDPSVDKIKTVYNQSMAYSLWKWFQRVRKGQPKPEIQTMCVLENINLVLKPGKMYLVLGPPASGKTCLLKAIAGRLSTSNGEKIEGSIMYNGLSLQDKRSYHVRNAIAFVDQLDFHAPRLTVQETFDFAFQCKSGGTHAARGTAQTDAAREVIKKLDKDKTHVNLLMEAFGLSHVADTFVGNSEVRGVSGGQRRRVTVGEMMGSASSVFCGDEISTGLDAASTYDICHSLAHFTRMFRQTRVISLLQAAPETVSLFDEIILLSEGRLIYVGPVEDAGAYFASLGYKCPNHIDIADFLQLVATHDGASLFEPSDKGGESRDTPYSMKELAGAFEKSERNDDLTRQFEEPWETLWESAKKPSLVGKLTLSELHEKYRNPPAKMVWLNFRRNITIWLRDKRFLIANSIKNLIMGVSVGGVFYQTDNVASIYGVIFQINLFIMLGAMVSVPDKVSDRIIFYKQFDANFYGGYFYAIADALALLPQALIDVMIFGTIIYWMVGFTAAASNYFIFIAVLFSFSVAMNTMLSIFAAFAKTKSEVQGYSAVVLLFQVLFSGFIVLPTVIPNYYSWLYWWNPLAWTYRAVVVNEFTSEEWEEPSAAGVTEGELALRSGGQLHKGETFGREWIGYAFAYLLPYSFLCVLLTGWLLSNMHAEPAQAAKARSEDNDSFEEDSEPGEATTTQTDEVVQIPFTPVTLSFDDVCYDVKVSKGKGTLRLLSDVCGVFRAGRMTALMGSSGAGKTTLMDVIALRKTSGTISGDVRLNGFEQERNSFRRCSGYVEQFDVQAGELTVRETVLYSARLRLDNDDPATADDDIKQKYVDQVLGTLELKSLANSLVGREGEGGLSFEQRKRVSIAVELAASPSIIFLDEPTSGLDSRAALIVAKVLRRIADSGRTVIATIHQPSSAVFEMFDDLLLLKKGGRTVFFGELGQESRRLITYFESIGAKPIGRGENPANWMLTAMTSEDTDFDYADKYLESKLFTQAKSDLKDINETRDPGMEVKFDKDFAAPWKVQHNLTNKRLTLIYWRSPAYNYARMFISLMIGFILGSVFVTRRKPDKYTEQEINSVLSTVFISFIIVGVLAINSVLPVMMEIRDIYYRHRAAGMIGHFPVAVALGVAEKWFIVLSSAFFCVIFLPMMGFNANNAGKSFAFWGFFTFNIALYSYFGQAFVCLVRGMKTAQILASVYIGINNFFSGLIVRPQYLSGIFKFSYWITPGHYVYEGLIMTQFWNDDTDVEATAGSSFYESLVAAGRCVSGDDACTGTVAEYVDDFFGGEFSRDHLVVNACVLGGILLLTRALTLLALRNFNYTST